MNRGLKGARGFLGGANGSLPLFGHYSIQGYGKIDSLMSRGT
jgi:hypothetical protein